MKVIKDEIAILKLAHRRPAVWRGDWRINAYLFAAARLAAVQQNIGLGEVGLSLRSWVRHPLLADLGNRLTVDDALLLGRHLGHLGNQGVYAGHLRRPLTITSG